MTSNFTFFRDLYTEDKGGKYSSKKFWGHIFLALIGFTYLVDGFDWYDINVSLFNSVLIAGCTLIGLNTVKGMFNKKDKTPTT